MRAARRLPRVLLLLLGTALATAAWVLLVLQAISLGRDARDGDGTRTWALTGAATVGAAICLMLAFALLVRVRSAWRAEPEPLRPAAGHRRH